MIPEDVIRILGLQPLPIEGGYFRETWRSGHSVKVAGVASRHPGDRSCGTAIYYLLTAAPDCFSALHSLPIDEIYHFYLGDPVELLLLRADGSVNRVLLGPDILNGQAVQLVVPAGVWQGSRLLPGGRFALMGTTMAPGFDPQDFVLGQRNELLARYPRAVELIRALTR